MLASEGEQVQALVLRKGKVRPNRPTFACARRGRSVGHVMVANNIKKLKPEVFDDLPVLKRKWQAARRPGEKLPRFEKSFPALKM